MIRLKQYIKIISLFALLFVVVSVPALFMEHQSKHSFNESVLYSVDTVQLGRDDGNHGDNSVIQKDSIWDRIKLICSSNVVVQSAKYTNFQANPDLQKDLLSSMEEQLRLLQTLNVLPELSFSDAVRISFSKETYMNVSSNNEEYVNLSDHKQVISIWAIQAEYQDFHVLAYMDADTSALYDITITSKGSSFLYSTSISENGFLEYLQLFSDGMNESEDVFSVGSYYTNQMICLYPISVHKQTGQITSYRVGNHEIKTYDWEIYSSKYRVFEVPSTEY